MEQFTSNMMDFNVKKLASGAATALSRAVQYTEEKLGTSERTELDAHFENLSLRSDRTRNWTERILLKTEGVLTPNPNNRVEDFFFEKLDKRPRDRLTNLEMLGVDMVEAGNDFGSGTPYGAALIKVGHTEQKLGQAEKEFIRQSAQNFTQPLHKFMEGEMKTIMKERRILETKRLDLDACKSRLRKARSMSGQQNADRDLRIAQSEFDRQAEITKLLLEGVSSAHSSHHRYLTDFVEAQIQFYAQCHQYMTDLQREIAGSGNSMSLTNNISSSSLYGAPSVPANSDDVSSTSGGGKKARVLYDYDAADPRELSLLADEVITVNSMAGLDSDWLMGERGSQKGRVPVAYLELIE